MKRLTHSVSGPVSLVLGLAVGEVEVVAEGREDAVVELSPVVAGDEVAEDLIARAEGSSRGEVFEVRVPYPEPVHIGSTTFGPGAAGTVTAVFSGSGSVTVFNGPVVSGGAVVHQVSTGGAVRVVARVPMRSVLCTETLSASVRAGDGLREVEAQSKSGAVEVGAVEQVSAHTISGAVRVGESADVAVKTVSGSIRVLRLTGSAQAKTVSGSVDIHAAGDSRVQAKTVSGSIEVTAADGARVQCHTKTVSGRVRAPRS